MKFFIEDDKVFGEFRLGKINPGRHGKRRLLCSLEALEFAIVGGHKKRRTDKQKTKHLEKLFSEKLEELLAAEKKKKSEQENGVSLTKLFDSYIKEKTPYLRQSSIKEYKNSFRHFLAAVGERKTTTFDKLTAEQALLRYLDKKSIRYPYKIFAHINYFLSWVLSKGYAVKRLTPPKKTKKLPRVLSVQEIELFKAEIMKADKRNAINLKRAFSMLLYTGMRVSELTNLKLADFDTDSCFIRIKDNVETRHKVKGLHEETIPMHSALKDIILADRLTRKPPEIYWLDRGNGKPAYSRGDKLTFPFSKILKKLNIEGMPVHIFRYTLATILTAKGVPVQTIKEILRHKDINTTLHYINSTSINTKPVIELLDY